MAEKPLVMMTTEALRRYRAVSAVEALMAGGKPLAEAVLAVARAPSADTMRRPGSIRTLYRWRKAFLEKSLAGLEPAARPHEAGAGVLGDELMDFIREHRDLDRDASLPELIRQARELGLVRPHENLDRTTLWRVCRRLGIETRRRRRAKDRDRRRFAAPDRMLLALADFVHFRAGPTRARRAALYFLDNATRYGLAVAVSTSEHTEIFLHALHGLLCRHGLLVALYLDRGPAFISDDTTRVLAQLDIAHILGEAQDPAAHGEIERFNRSARARVLRCLNGAQDVDPDCGALTLRLHHDLTEVYNHLPHEGLGFRTPAQCWAASTRPLRPPPDKAWLEERFTITEERRVSADNVIKHDGALFEVPRGHAGDMVTIQRRVLQGDALYLPHQDRLVRLHHVDLTHNAMSLRARDRPEHDDLPETPPAPTASALSFKRAYKPLLDADGGYHGSEQDETTKE